MHASCKDVVKRLTRSKLLRVCNSPVQPICVTRPSQTYCESQSMLVMKDSLRHADYTWLRRRL